MSAVDPASATTAGYESQTVSVEAESPAAQVASTDSEGVTSITQTAASATAAVEPSNTSSQEISALMEETGKLSTQVNKSSTAPGMVGVIEAVIGLVTTLVGLITSLMGSKQGSSGTDSSSTSGSSSSGSSTSDPKSSTGSSSAPSSTSGTKTPASTNTTPAAQSTKGGLQAIADERGMITIRTPDGYQVKTDNKEQGWNIIGPEGRATRIWGDPHVKESDGTRWDFQKQSSFLFGSNKVTVETKPIGNGKAVTSRITVYNGLERVTVAGIDSNKPFILAVSEDGKQHDDSVSDGNRFSRGMSKTGESWSQILNGRRDVMGR